MGATSREKVGSAAESDAAAVKPATRIRTVIDFSIYPTLFPTTGGPNCNASVGFLLYPLGNKESFSNGQTRVRRLSDTCIHFVGGAGAIGRGFSGDLGRGPGR